MRVDQRKRAWRDDLLRVYEGTMTFDSWVREHRPLIRSIVRRWSAGCSDSVTFDDLMQLSLLAVWEAVLTWDPTRGRDISGHARFYMRDRLGHYLRSQATKHRTEVRYFDQQIVEERVLHRSYTSVERELDSSTAPRGIWVHVVEPAPLDELIDFQRMANRLVGALPPQQAAVVAAVVGGEDTAIAERRIYGANEQNPRKRSLRAMADAIALVKQLHARDCRQETPRHATSDPNPKTLRPIRKISRTHPRERPVAVAS